VNGTLERIVDHKRREVKELQDLYPVKLLERSPYFSAPAVSLCKYLRRQDKVGVIAEIKRKSPSAGVLKEDLSVEQISIGYMQAGASALSVVTDHQFFGGSNDDLTTARRFNFCPVLRKDFIISDYQLIEARSIGADAVLLIASILPPASQASLGRLARELGMEVLLEVHSEKELKNAALECADLIGVNNRNLDTLQIDANSSAEIGALIPAGIPKIAESGLHDAAQIVALKRTGFDGFLIGESFMQSSKPAAACERLIREVRRQMEHNDTGGCEL
jgi:indole-3-glycerol phosphate synthase